jgi:hypothetical protein
MRRPRLRVLTFVGLLVATAVLSVGGMAWASDHGGRPSGPLDGESCSPGDGRSGKVSTDYGRADRGSRQMTIFCQSGPPVLTLEVGRGGKVTVDPPGTTCASTTTDSRTCVIKFRDTRSVVTLRAKSADGVSQFFRWGYDCYNQDPQATGTCVMPMNHSRTIAADFMAPFVPPVLTTGPGPTTAPPRP